MENERIETLYNTKLVKCGNKLTIVKYQGLIRQGAESHNNTGRRGKKELSEEEKARYRSINKRNNLNKARGNIINAISCNEDMQTFITLTYKENMQDIRKSKSHLAYFFKKLKKDYKDIKFLYVLEFQGRGAIHYHMLCNLDVGFKSQQGRYKRKSEKHKMYEDEFNKKYWNRGFIDIQLLKDEGIRKVGNYIACYLTEDLFEKDLQGNRCWGHSRNLNKPQVTKCETNLQHKTLMITDSNAELIHQRTYERAYTNKAGKEYKSKIYYYEYILKE